MKGGGGKIPALRVRALKSQHFKKKRRTDREKERDRERERQILCQYCTGFLKKSHSFNTCTLGKPLLRQIIE